MRLRVPEGEIGTLLTEMVILRLKEQKYLNDTNYADAYSSSRRDNDKFGKRRVITDLKIKGVHADVIEKVVGEAYSEVNEEELARAFLKRKRIKKPENNKDTARIFRALVRAGFGAGNVHQDIEKLGRGRRSFAGVAGRAGPAIKIKGKAASLSQNVVFPETLLGHPVFIGRRLI